MRPATCRQEPNVPSTASTAKPRSFVVIPARYASTRLPRKMLLRETGKTLLQHTYEAACAARKPAGVIIATDHAEIAREVERFHGDFVMTSPDCASGTDRVAEVARQTAARRNAGQRAGRRAGNVAGEHRPRDRAVGTESVGRHGHARHADAVARAASPNPACVKVVFDDAWPRDVLQPQPDPVRARSGYQPSRSTIRRCFSSTSASTPIAARRCSKSPRCRRRRSSKPRSSNNSACCNPAARSGGRRRARRQRHRHAGRLCRVRRPPPRGGLES